MHWSNPLIAKAKKILPFEWIQYNLKKPKHTHTHNCLSLVMWKLEQCREEYIKGLYLGRISIWWLLSVNWPEIKRNSTLWWSLNKWVIYLHYSSTLFRKVMPWSLVFIGYSLPLVINKIVLYAATDKSNGTNTCSKQEKLCPNVLTCTFFTNSF